MKKLFLFVMMMVAAVASAQTTPNLGLNIPAHNATNWDTLLNTNFSQLDLYLSSGKSIPSLVISGNLSVGGTCTGCGSGSTPGGDLSGNATSQEVIGVLNNALPSLAVGALTWTGSAWTFSSGSVTGTGAATQVTVWSGSTTLTSYSGFTTDSSGDVTVLTLATNGSNAGLVALGAGADNAGNCGTSYVCDEAPTSVTKYTIVRAGSGPSAVNQTPVYTALASSKTTQSWNQLTNSVFWTIGVGTIGASNGTAYVMWPQGSQASTFTGSTAQELVHPSPATVQNMNCSAATAATSSGTTIKFYKDGSAAGPVCAIGTSSTCSSTGTTTMNGTTDTWSIRVVTGQATETIANVRCTVQFF